MLFNFLSIYHSLLLSFFSFSSSSSIIYLLFSFLLSMFNNSLLSLFLVSSLRLLLFSSDFFLYLFSSFSAIPLRFLPSSFLFFMLFLFALPSPRISLFHTKKNRHKEDTKNKGEKEKKRRKKEGGKTISKKE